MPRVGVVLDQRPTAFDKHDRRAPAEWQAALAENVFKHVKEVGARHVQFFFLFRVCFGAGCGVSRRDGP
jgi:hypothetical protein